MAKVAATCTLSPSALSISSDVLVEDALDVVEMLNWVAANRPQSHVSMTMGRNFASGSSRGVGIEFLTVPGAYVERLRFSINVAVETQVLDVSAQCEMFGLDDGDVRITVGAAAPVSFNVTTATNGSTQATTINTSSSGTGWLLVTVELRLTVASGTAPGAYLYNLRIQDAVIAAASLPNPG